jgi:poly-gamma-glutamate capsule biosynthesis protein CapA/YwtB (metallophosphatase superfamily)
MKKAWLSFLFLLLALAAAAQAPTVLRLSFLGDLMAHTVNFRMRDFHDIYRGVRDVIMGDDLTFANLELPIDETRPAAGYPTFNGPRAYWKAAVDSGIEVFSLANNHAFDQGETGILQTLRSAESIRRDSAFPLYVSGIRGNLRRPFSAETITVKGLRVGYIAATQMVNQGGACPYVNVVDYLDRGAADEFVSFVRQASRGFDVFIVSYHGGREYASEPDGRMLSFFRRLLQNGALIVHGHHPHVFQRCRLVKVDGETRVSLPSMGNFISGMTWDADPSAPRAALAETGDSTIFCIDVLRVGAGAYVSRVEAIPISTYRNRRGEYVVGRLRNLSSGSSGLTKAWSCYFEVRLSEMEKLLSPVHGDE